MSIGGAKPLTCLPLIGKLRGELIGQAKQLKILAPDLLEWRADYFEQVEDIDACLFSLRELRKEIGKIPLIFTLRSSLEGGQCKLAEYERQALIIEALMSGEADIFDIEMSNKPVFIESIKKAKVQTQSKLILSYHNFDSTPSEEVIVDKLVQAEEMGADIAKVAVMPKNNGDVLTLLGATNRARTTLVNIPIITMSMGATGAVTRLVGGQFGSDITFAIGEASSASGQLPIADVRRVMDILGY